MPHKLTQEAKLNHFLSIINSFIPEGVAVLKPYTHKKYSKTKNYSGSDVKFEPCHELISSYGHCSELIGVIEVLSLWPGNGNLFTASPAFVSSIPVFQTSFTFDTKAFVRMCRFGRLEAGPRNARAVLHRSPKQRECMHTWTHTHAWTRSKDPGYGAISNLQYKSNHTVISH